MSRNLPEGNWLLTDDWNMTKHFDDVVGPLAKLHGNKERSWKIALDALDYIDHYLTTTNCKGLVFMRKAVSGIFFDQLRLDRIYSSHWR